MFFYIRPVPNGAIGDQPMARQGDQPWTFLLYLQLLVEQLYQTTRVIQWSSNDFVRTKPAERPRYNKILVFDTVVDTASRGVSVLESVGLINCKNISVSVTHAQTSVLDQCQYCYSNHILIGVQTMVKRVVGSWACKSRSSVVN